MEIVVGKTYYGEKGPNRRVLAMDPSRTCRTYHVSYIRIKKNGTDGAQGRCYEDAFEKWAKGEVQS
ncbi:hypothetical protein HGI30_14995 [Paenibacillus albicereus]|uniref:Uncharacterized protein n=1 Tax=Paenibacillus albicereus TaxID=2726185 RepID=A0A6H2GZG9_9BACL|nr:hypothetical protein [Paenibacillus albicereus]QJC52739.1 hypothetical protein HGI30_14995 [Paenibacillus albicereus]